MTDTFGIFVEDSVPAVHGVLKELPTFIKGKAITQNIKKKALGDVSNTVSQKVLNVQPHEKTGKLLVDSCSATQEKVSTTCKPLSDVKETPKEISDGCAESDYDILFKSQRLTGKEIDLFTSFYSHQPYSPTSSPTSDFDLPDLFTPMIPAPLPFEEYSPIDELEDLSFSDVSIPSSDEQDFADVFL